MFLCIETDRFAAADALFDGRLKLHESVLILLQQPQTGHIAKNRPHRQIRIQGRAFGQKTDVLLALKRKIPDLAAADENIAGGRRQLTGHHIHQR